MPLTIIVHQVSVTIEAKQRSDKTSNHAIFNLNVHFLYHTTYFFFQIFSKISEILCVGPANNSKITDQCTNILHCIVFPQ